MVAVQFVVVLLRLLRLPLLTQSASPQTLSPDNVAMQGVITPTRLIPETGPASSRYLQQMPPLKPAKPLPPLVKRLAAETAGTALIVGGGCGAACALKDATSASAYVMPILWGVFVATAVTSFREASGAHFNPAVTLAFALNNRDGGMANSRRDIGLYIAAQCFGATLASLAMAGWFAPQVAATQVIQPLMPLLSQSISEMSITALLVFCIFAIGDPDLHVPHELVPTSVGVVITLINIGFGSFGIGLNPARDLGPRLVAAFTGEFHLFEPGAWIYLIGPVFGAILGGYAYTTGSRYARSKLMVRRASADLRNQGVWGVVVPTEQSVRQSLEQSYPAPRPLSY